MLAQNLAKITWFMDDLDAFFDMEESAKYPDLNILWQDFIIEIIIPVIES
jgi:hypothetical protein